MANVAMMINDVRIEAEPGWTILKAAQSVGLRIPTLCNREDLTASAACRLCVVEVAGARTLVPACAFPVSEGMDVHTNSPRVRRARETILQLLLANHPMDCLTCSRNGTCELQALTYEYGVTERPFKGETRVYQIDVASPSLERDPNKCILCGRCVKVCEDVQGVGVIDFTKRGFETIILPVFNRHLSETACVNCGQCALACPTGALSERDSTRLVWDALSTPGKHVIVQTAPAVRASLGEEFGMPAGSLVTGKMVAALRRLGFDRVFDTNFTADLTILEEGTEFVGRVKNGGLLPIITSCSPGWIKYIEHNHPNLLPNLSSCKSPQQMFGAIAKTYYAELTGLHPKDIVVVSIMPCTAKKFEATRPEMADSGVADVDVVLTTRELARMLRAAGIDFQSLPDEDFDLPLGISTGAADIFASSGGVAEAALRSAYFLITNRELDDVNFTAVRGLDGVKEATIPIDGLEVRVAVANGLKNAETILQRVESGEADYHFIEIMACPGGCIGGGGQPRPWSREKLQARMQAIYREDAGKERRRSHHNPVIIRLYEEYLDHPGSEKAHHLLHTRYMAREAE